MSHHSMSLSKILLHLSRFCLFFFFPFWEDSLGEFGDEAETRKSLEKIPTTWINLLKHKQILKSNIYKQRVKFLELHTVTSPRGAEGSSLQSVSITVFPRSCWAKGLVMMGWYLQQSSCHVNPMVGLHCLFAKCFFVKCSDIQGEEGRE